MTKALPGNPEGEYRNKHRRAGDDGVVRDGQPCAGHAQPRGPDHQTRPGVHHETFGLTRISPRPTVAAPTGVILLSRFSHPGCLVARWRGNHLQTPTARSAMPPAIRPHAAQVGAGRLSPSSRRGSCTKTAVVAASPNSQPDRKARPVAR